MKFLAGTVLGKALKSWREAKRLRNIDICKNSVTLSQKTLKPGNISALESEGKGFGYQQLIDNIFPAYGVNDICDYDLLLDYCFAPDVNSIAHIQAEDRDVRNGDGTKEILIPPDKLKSNRARISIIEIAPQKQTVWQNHEGHEYVMVYKGEVVAEFGDTDSVRQENRKTFTLNKGDGLAFSSAIYHTFKNYGTITAELIIARPTKSLPKGMHHQSSSK